MLAGAIQFLKVAIKRDIYKMTALQKFCEIARKPSFNAQYFQTSWISDIRFNENA